MSRDTFQTPQPAALGWSVALGLWGLVWMLSAIAGSHWLEMLGLSINAHGHSHLYAHGHPFVDARSWWGIPNTLDVLSNLPILAAGVGGWLHLRRVGSRTSPSYRPAVLACIGLVLSSVGSWVYHWHPMPETLVLDRMGMAVTFAGVLGWMVVERLQALHAYRFALCVVVIGLLSAALPVVTGNVVPWAVLQFGGLALLFMHVLLPITPSNHAPHSTRLAWPWLGLLLFYGLAKLLEMNDVQVFTWSHGIVAGHALKHLAAACALTPLLLYRTDCGRMPIPKAHHRSAISKIYAVFWGTVFQRR